VVVCVEHGRVELIDGFKRLAAARVVAGLGTLSARQIEADDRTAKAAIYVLNRVGGRTRELEEAWIVQALVREDGLTQQEVAELLGRHKSWVCRRLALIERLGPEARRDLQLGLLTPTAARAVSRLPCGNQAEVVELIRRESLSSSETQRVVDLLLACADEPQQRFVLTQPREALCRERGAASPARDPRLSPAGNRVWRRLGLLLELLPRMENWLRSWGHAELASGDRSLIEPGFTKLAQQARAVAEASEDFVAEGALR
jgi:ParB-like chromosome segregation protein Spo0J